jgi:hypothetical protein
MLQVGIANPNSQKEVTHIVNFVVYVTLNTGFHFAVTVTYMFFPGTAGRDE